MRLMGLLGQTGLSETQIAAMVTLRDQLQGQNLELAAVGARDDACRVGDLCLWQRRVEIPLLLRNLPHVRYTIGRVRLWKKQFNADDALDCRAETPNKFPQYGRMGIGRESSESLSCCRTV